MHIAHLARAENDLLASPLEDKLRFVFREHVRGAVVLLRQLLPPLHHLAGEANDHVVLIGLSLDCDGSECGAFDLHAVILVPISGRSSNALTLAQQTNSPRVTAGSHYQTGSTPFPPFLAQIILKRRASPVHTTTNVSRHRRRAVGFPPRRRSWVAREA